MLDQEQYLFYEPKFLFCYRLRRDRLCVLRVKKIDYCGVVMNVLTVKE